MKILLVGDNRTSPNWGGRAVSIALHRLLSKRHTISGVVTGLRPLELGYVNTTAPTRVSRFFEGRRHRTRVAEWYLGVERLLGGSDTIVPDPKRTADHIVRYRGRYPELADLYDKVGAADAVVINAEGDLVFTTPPRRIALFLLAMAELGLEMGKSVYVVNSLVADCPLTGRNDQTVAAARDIFTRCQIVLTRDPDSLSYVRREMPGVASEYVPDAAFLWSKMASSRGSNLPSDGDFLIPFPEKDHYLGRLDFSQPYVLLGGSAGVGRERERALQSYRKLLRRLQDLGLPVYLIEADGPDSFLDEIAIEEGVGIVPVYTPIVASASILANARLLVSGRYHPSILASLGGAPCVFLGATSHKTQSLQRVLGYDEQTEFGVFPSDDEIERIVHLGRRYLLDGANLREAIREVAGRRSLEAGQLLDWIGDRSEASRQTMPAGPIEMGTAR